MKTNIEADKPFSNELALNLSEISLPNHHRHNNNGYFGRMKHGLPAKMLGLFLSGVGGVMPENAKAQTQPIPVVASNTPFRHKEFVAPGSESLLGSGAAISEVGHIGIVGPNEATGNLRIRVVKVERVNQLDEGKTSRSVAVVPEPLFVPWENPKPIPGEPVTVFGITHPIGIDGKPDHRYKDVTFRYFLSSQMLRAWGRELADFTTEDNQRSDLQDQYPLVGATITWASKTNDTVPIATARVKSLQNVDLDNVSITFRFETFQYNFFKALAAQSDDAVGSYSIATMDAYKIQTVKIENEGIQELENIARAEINSNGLHTGNGDKHLLTQGDVNSVVQKVLAQFKTIIRAVGGPEAAQLAIAESASNIETLVMGFLKENTLTGKEALDLLSQPEIKANIASHAKALNLQVKEGKDTSETNRDSKVDESGYKHQTAHAETKGESSSGGFLGFFDDSSSSQTTDLKADENFNRKLQELEKQTGIKTTWDQGKQMYVPSEIRVFQVSDTSSTAEIKTGKSITLALDIEDRPKRGPFVPIGFTANVVQENIRAHFGILERLKEIEDLKGELLEAYSILIQHNPDLFQPELLKPDFNPGEAINDPFLLEERLGYPVSSALDMHKFRYLGAVIEQAKIDKAWLDEEMGVLEQGFLPALQKALEEWECSVQDGGSAVMEKRTKNDPALDAVYLNADLKVLIDELHWPSSYPESSSTKTSNSMSYRFDKALGELRWDTHFSEGQKMPSLRQFPKLNGHPLAWALSAKDIMQVYHDREATLTEVEKNSLIKFLTDGEAWKQALNYYDLAENNSVYVIQGFRQMPTYDFMKIVPNDLSRLVLYYGPIFLRDSIGTYYFNNRGNMKALQALRNRDADPWREAEVGLMHTAQFWRLIEADLVIAVLVGCQSGQMEGLLPTQYSKLIFHLEEIKRLASEDNTGFGFMQVSDELMCDTRPFADKVISAFFTTFIRSSWLQIENMNEEKDWDHTIKIELDDTSLEAVHDGWYPEVISLLRRLYYPDLRWDKFPWEEPGVREVFESSLGAFRRFAEQVGIRNTGVNVE